MKLPKLIHWPSTAIFIAVCCIAGFVTYKWTGWGFWAGFGLVAIGMLVNGWIAAIEDEQPGGFNNPKDEKTDPKDG